MIKKIISLTIIFFISLFFTSCWDSKDIQFKNIVLCPGIDYENDIYKLYAEVASIRKEMTNEQGSSEIKNVAVLSGQGKSLNEARIELDRVADFPMFLGAARAFVFSQSSAKHGIEPVINMIGGIFDYRKTTDVVICDDKIEDLYHTVPENDISVGFSIEDTIDDLTNKGVAINVTVGDILGKISVEYADYLIPYIGLEESQLKFLGYGVMKDSKLVGLLPDKKAKGMVFILSPKTNLVYDVSLPSNEDNKISFIVELRKKDISIKYVNHKVVIDVDINITAELEFQYHRQAISDALKNQVQEIISKKVQKDITSIIEKSQKEYKCDFLNFYKHFRARYPDIYRKINWREKYCQAKINIDVSTNIKNAGLIDLKATKRKDNNEIETKREKFHQNN